RPPLRQGSVQLVPGAQVAPLAEEDKRRESEAEANQRDVNRQRQRLHLARLEQVLLIDRREAGGEDGAQPSHAGSIAAAPFPAPRSARRQVPLRFGLTLAGRLLEIELGVREVATFVVRGVVRASQV